MLSDTIRQWFQDYLDAEISGSELDSKLYSFLYSHPEERDKVLAACQLHKDSHIQFIGEMNAKRFSSCPIATTPSSHIG